MKNLNDLFYGPSDNAGTGELSIPLCALKTNLGPVSSAGKRSGRERKVS